MHLAAGADYCTKVQHRWGRKMCVPGGAKGKRFVSGPRGSGPQFDQAILEFLQLSSEMRNIVE
jgi:hypothetical protein